MDRGAAALGLGHHRDDLAKQGVAPDALGLHHKTAGAIDRAARDLVADGFFHRQRFPGQHGLLHTGVALDEFAIHRHFFPGNHTQAIADLHLFQRDFLVTALRDKARGGWSQIEQGLDGAAGPAAGAEFEHLTQQYQHHNHGGCLEVNGHLAIMAHAVRKNIRQQHGDDAENKCRTHTDGDEREHIEVPTDDGTPATLEKRPASPDDHRRGERELNPARNIAADPWLPAQRRDHVRHRQQEHGQCQRRADPEAPRHVLEFGVATLIVDC